MAALIPKYTLAAARRQTICASSIVVPVGQYSTSPRIIKNPTITSMKRGTGGRSSFNGIVCTIFGNTGFIGKGVCNRLGKIGTQLILPHRQDMYESMRLKVCGDLGQILFHPFDLKNEASILKCITHSNVVINLIGRDYETSNYSYHDVHVEGARRLARLAKQCNVERFIHVSSTNSSPHPEPKLLKYGSMCLKSKWEGEQAVREEFPEATIVKCSDVYGMGDRFLSHYTLPFYYCSRRVPLWKNGKFTEKQPLYVSDVAAGITEIVKNPQTAGKTYQFFGPKRYNLRVLSLWLQDIVYKYVPSGILDSFQGTTDIQYKPLFQLRVHLSELATTGPLLGLHWEGLEMRSTSDVVVNNLPTLADLGVFPLIQLEDQAPYELKYHCRVPSYDVMHAEDLPSIPLIEPVA